MRRSTSDEAFQKIRDELPARRAEVFEFVWSSGPATAKELEVEMFNADSPNWRDCNKRLSELERQGVIESLVERVCLITGNKAMAWKATGRMPVPLWRKPRVKLFHFKIKDCATCLLASEIDDDDGYREVCWLDPSVKLTVRGRPANCPMDGVYAEFRART